MVDPEKFGLESRYQDLLPLGHFRQEFAVADWCLAPQDGLPSASTAYGNGDIIPASGADAFTMVYDITHTNRYIST